MSEFEVKEKTYNLPNEHRQVLNVIRNTSNKYITKTKLLNQLGNDKEFYIFDSLIQGRSYKDISSVLECSEQSVRLWYETLLDKIVEVIE